MQREGSPVQGMSVVLLKELADHLRSGRMRVLEWLIILTAAAALYGVFQQIRNTTASDPYVFLRLFTAAQEPMPSFSALLGFLVPLVAIGLGFDAVNGEYSRRTMSRLLSQPIYRDALLMGKFLAGLATLAISLLALWLLVIGAGLILLGVPPGGEEIARSLLFLLLTLAYAGVWLAVAMLCSIVFRSAATSALVSLGLWLFLSLLWPMLAGALAQAVAPPDPVALMLGQPGMETLQWQQALERLSPSQLFGEGVLALLVPSTRTLGPVFLSQLQGAVIGSPLPLSQSLAIVWPQLVGLIAAVILLFTLAYMVFQRREVRA
ncbi:ABC transporter permease [Pigmentiphaga sp. NML080357]|uniref:ABC transporter permease n=1 Tax=Pigmentiphaga sp. NML080357 TaxID=2008675 RepID=UPI000B417C66|nr:ABC transporter permease [Pigmentiphaga sp. NML080357]OVZ59300.1 ABC transporter permease [Pigmentiphaga sp. NML080357]